MLSSVELEALVAFLNSGKAAYIEGNDFVRDHAATPLLPLAGCAFDSDGGNWYNGALGGLVGEEKSIAQGLSFDYLDEIEPNESCDVIRATTGQLIFSSRNGKGRAVSYRGSAQRVIVSSFAFGALKDGASTKKELMRRYLQFLTAPR